MVQIAVSEILYDDSDPISTCKCQCICYRLIIFILSWIFIIINISICINSMVLTVQYYTKIPTCANNYKLWVIWVSIIFGLASFLICIIRQKKL